MSIQILLREHPHRSIALKTEKYALILRHSPSTIEATGNGSLNSIQSPHGNAPVTPRCMVEFTRVDATQFDEYRPLSAYPVQGTLGLITVNNDVFLCLVSRAQRVANVRPEETVQKIQAVEFYCINTPVYDEVLNDEVNSYPTDDLSSDWYESPGSLSGSQRRDTGFEHPCLALKKLLSNGSFYYSTDFDLTNRLQDRSALNAVFDIDSLDDGFLWNSYMISPLLKFRSRLSPNERNALDSTQILTSAIRGFVKTMAIPASSSPARTSSSGLPSTLTLISRLSCRRAGTRFNARGIDDDGNVANFVETETVFWIPPGLSFSYVQIRGSVPLFWEQATGLLPGQQKISITRSAEATQPAFDKHFESLELDYGSVHILNLLSDARPGEADLTSRYRYHVRQSPYNQRVEKGDSSDHALLKETNFDFHAETKGPAGYEAASQIRHLIKYAADGFAYYISDEQQDNPQSEQRSVVVLQQEGVFRTNCLDCLDRTNLIQTIISQLALEAFLTSRQERAAQDFWMRHSTLWADNGDALSRIYAGTGALKTSFTRTGKMSLAGAIADARKSATRLYINNFADKGRQNTMDMLLGRLMGQAPVLLHDPINDHVTVELKKRAAEYSSQRTIKIHVGTFNLNGRTDGLNEDLSQWLCPGLGEKRQDADIVAVGFQEIVELSPQQIMSTDPARRQAWERAVKRTLNNHTEKDGKEEYVLLRSGQLVGAALSIFARSSVLQDIKNVEGSVKKTGMSGMAGNKGAVAIRMDYANTPICFVTAHLAAGFANYDERNRDYKTISHGLHFQRNRSIEDHDAVIWLGDFNYRIGLADDKVRKLVQMGDLEQLYQNDQLNVQMVAGLTFPFYSEARITFLPTYKYNVGTDDYDTSEKSRIPAWCDRVLFKSASHILRQIAYDSCTDIKFSDHRPVYATFQCLVTTVDESLKGKLSDQIYKARCVDVGKSTASAGGGSLADGDDTDDEDLIGYDVIAPGLPPASSDRRKWWLDGGAPVRSAIKPPQSTSIPNPHRPSNPFSPTDQPEWVEIPSQNKSIRPPDPPAARRAPARKLPPPFMPTSTHPSSQDQTISKPPLPPNPTRSIAVRGSRSSSAASQPALQESQRKKAAPPVPKKPVELANTRPDSSASSSYVTPSTSPRMITRVNSAGWQVDGFTRDERSPPLPVRPPTTNLSNEGPMDVMVGDADGDEGLRGWQVLQPQ